MTQCTATVYRDCPDQELCGTKNGVSCDYIPDGIGQTQCGWNACSAVQGTGDWQSVCGGGDAIDITGGCVAQVAKGSLRQPKQPKAEDPMSQVGWLEFLIPKFLN